MECAGIADLAKGCNLGADSSTEGRPRWVTEPPRATPVWLSRVILKEILDRRRDRDADEGSTASHRFEVRIDKFTNHDDLLQRVEWVNNIWLKANQCLTARVDA